MAEYEKRGRDKLASSGCRFIHRGKGDHDIWYSPITNKTFPVNHRIKSRHTANAIMKQSGIAYKFRTDINQERLALAGLSFCEQKEKAPKP